MGKIYYMMGKSSSGKDTLFREILEEMPQLKTVTLYTTRPMREGEQDGEEYFFVAEYTLQSYEKQGKVIEQRAYETVHGIWRYATVDDGQADLKHEDYLMIGTLESYEKMRSYYGEERIVPIYIEVEDGERLMRALKRERQQETPRYAEMCRRFLADTQDFSEQNLQRLGITRRYVNQDKQQCRKEIIEDIRYGKL